MRFRSTPCLLTLGLLLAACQSSPETSREQTPGDMPRGSGAGKRAAALEARDVAWPSRSRVDRAAVAALPDRALSALRLSPVPVLAPKAPSMLRDAVLTTGDHWSALSTREDGLTLAVQASGTAVRHEGIGPVRGNRSIRGTRGFVTQETGIWSATWIENGVAYSADLECAVAGDDRCASEAFLMELVEGLVFVGGREVAP